MKLRLPLSEHARREHLIRVGMATESIATLDVPLRDMTPEERARIVAIVRLSDTEPFTLVRRAFGFELDFVADQVPISVDEWLALAATFEARVEEARSAAETHLRRFIAAMRRRLGEPDTAAEGAADAHAEGMQAHDSEGWSFELEAMERDGIPVVWRGVDGYEEAMALRDEVRTLDQDHYGRGA